MGGGGGDWGYLELGPGTAPWVRGSIYKKKVLQDPGPNTHTAATIPKVLLTPPTPAPKKEVLLCTAQVHREGERTTGPGVVLA